MSHGDTKAPDLRIDLPNDDEDHKMISAIDRQSLYDRLRADKELLYRLRGFAGTVRIDAPEAAFDITFRDGAPEMPHAPEGQAAVTFSGTEDFWKTFLDVAPLPAGYESLTMATNHGASLEGDLVSVLAPWRGGWQRLFLVLRAATAGELVRKPFSDPFRASDNAVGRYLYVSANGAEARIYYETAGTGPIPLLLQATAGADSRQYRHLLADPAMQQRFTMYAYDLPYHGKSLPPFGVRWWEQAYLPDRDQLMNWVVAIADELDLVDPFFLGCSVGGQLALDLAAEHGDRFGAFLSVNGWYDVPEWPAGFSNDMFRSPAISDDYAPSLNFGATAPTAPEAYAHETYWVYRSGFPGIYAGDNDYFLYGHDLKQNGHKIDAFAKPVYVITGEYDPAAADEEHGGPAVEKFVPGTKSVTLTGLGHFAPCDDPIGFGVAILPILDEAIARVTSAR